ncbi:MAG: hypothetical protein ACFFE4_05775 [Candidatus Thorarchaeota archaeon]
MLDKDSKLYQIREDFIQQLFDEVCNVPSYASFKSNTFNIIAKLGLQLIAKQEGLFESEEWNNPEKQDVLLKRIHQFLKNHIK